MNLQALLEQSDSVFVGAGAGMSADSGLPTFRGMDGMWRKSRLQDLANPFAFEADPHLSWTFYRERLDLYRNAIPHIGYEILAKIQEEKNLFYATANVDGLAQKAGIKNVWEIHGSIHWLQCQEPCHIETWPTPNEQQLPLCPCCQKIARPNLCMFGDHRWIRDRYNRQAQEMRCWLEDAQKPLVLEVGAGTAIPSIRSLCANVASEKGCSVVRINPDDGDLRLGAAQALQLLVR